MSDHPVIESVPCVLCENDDPKVLLDLPPWRYVQCNNCSLVYVNPRPKENAVQKVYEKNTIMSWFKKKTYEFRRMAELKNIGDRLGRGESIMYEVAKYKTGGNILDVGCNRGFILANAAAWGWNIYGVEIVEWQTKMIKREFDATIFNERLRDIDPPFESKFFDAITMMDIVEHFHNPYKDLVEIHRILKDDGILILNTPDIGSAYGLVMGYDWSMDKPEEHLYLFDKNTIEKLLKKVGFKILCFNRSKGAPGEMEIHIQKDSV